MEHGSSYLKALSWLWGMGSLQTISAQNLDYVSEQEIEKKIENAIAEGMAIIKEF